METKIPNLMYSIKPQFIEMMFSNKKSIEIRKSIPQTTVPFNMLLYCTQGAKSFDYERFCVSRNPKGFVCGCALITKIEEYTFNSSKNQYNIPYWSFEQTGLSQEELLTYGQGKTLYGLVIHTLTVYKDPIGFTSYRDLRGNLLKRPPQSFCYIK